jgi:ABC-2 type transport system ATP-binding protein
VTDAIERVATVAVDAPSREPALVVNQLTKRFGERTAFSAVTFEVAYGEVFGFLGPNGAGKTTTVRALGTLIEPTSGTATVAGIPLSSDNGVAIRQRISIMPEAPGLYLRLTVAENLEFFAGLYGLHQPGPRIKEALASVNLADRADDLCGGLSKGLRQRVGLARALLSDPVIMFLDEPTSGLDPVAAREVHDLINGLRRKGVTIFLTTHRLDEVDGGQSLLDPRAHVRQAVEAGEELEVLGDRQARVQARSLRHDRDAAADRDGVLGAQRNAGHDG